ncbi:RNA 3'-terminal phosphate cyclase-like [Patiria miniata]|uniref:RNA 3'-terminal phosphate cyclase n=1 Tax=Patiria miniata TaxID=46514 RepID=A0A914B017_PATMI|nr:RNA 3'-terminal phosphate cyclase-like [Patiria miniata]XP_038069259.1 RNA 3'-terminal phosphate cyclase-like [Patiria miniata]
MASAAAAASKIIIDGSVMEGGGQILRIASALSCLTCQPITVQKVRAGRSKPGLRPQHLSGLQLVRDLCSGELIGGSVGSTEITFIPSKIKAGRYVADTKTAGSVVLLMQVSMPCMLFAAGLTQVTLKGGTNAEMAPQIDYTTLVFQPMIERFGVQFECDVKRRGYYPKGGGEIQVRTTPIQCLQPVDITDVGQVTKIEGRAFVAGVLPVKIAKSMADTASSIISSRFPSIPVHVKAVQEASAVGNGCGIIVVADTSTGCKLAGSTLGKKGVPAEQVGKEAAEMLLRNLDHGGCVDEYLQDQLIIFMALASGTSRVLSGPLTLHTKTAIHVTEKLTKAKFNVQKVFGEGDSERSIIECEGIGLQR